MLFNRTAALRVLLPPTAAPVLLATRVLEHLVVPERALRLSTAGELGARESRSSLLLKE